MKTGLLVTLLWLLVACSSDCRFTLDVRDAQNLQPVSDAHLDLKRLYILFYSGPIGASDNTGKNGQCDFQLIPEGTWMLTIDAAGYDIQEGMISIGDDSATGQWQKADIRRVHPFTPEKKIEYCVKNVVVDK